MNPPEVPPTPPEQPAYSTPMPPEVPPAPPSYSAPVQQPVQSYQAQLPPSNNLAIVSLVAGVIGVSGICCCPMLVGSIAAIICGHMGLSRSRRLGGLGKVPAIIGMVLGYFAIIGSAIYMTLAFNSPEMKKAIDQFQQEFKKSMEEAQQKQGTAP